MNLSINGIARAMLVFSVLTVSAIAGLAQTSDGALNKDGVKRTIAFMKQTNSSDQEIAGVISRTGVDFKPSAADERELRQAGASDAVINAVRGSYQGPAQPDNQPQENNPRPEDKAPKEDAATKENKTAKNTASENDTRRENNNRRTNDSQQARQQRNQNTEDEQTQPTTKAANDPQRPNGGPDGLTFQVGDRVEVDVTQMMPPNKKWYKATVVKVNTNSLGDVLDYDVKLNTVDGSEVTRDHIPKRPNWIRPLQ
jgi:flagellar biosynthesis GTPase FlhF